MNSRPLSYKNNRLQQIRGFCNTVIFGSVTEAAKEMKLSQSAISSQLKSLERDLNLKLFGKFGKYLKPTEEGKVFYDYIIPILRKIDSAYEEFAIETDKSEHNKLSIIAYHSAISCILPKYVAKILKDNSDIDLQIESADKAEGLQKLREKKADLALFAIDEIPHDLTLLKSFSFSPTLLVSKQNKLSARKDKISLEDIVKESVLLSDRVKILPLYAQLFDKYKIKSKIKFVNSSWEMIRFFVKQNIGISISMNYDTSRTDTEEMVDIDISHLFPRIEYRLLSRGNSKFLINSFLDVVKAIDGF